ncbi:MAG: 50S ribosomal protein L18 [Elusimicrobia bacterium GWA2_61_42]|nr:MAG: 50S ribosomal protein L18 [Elusimicrobia bacterium GWA2_61_42]OGR76879.1 MAG: 50S ribosomal protein L18 [Elusimicrobia bacterium GWC2_61_25]
MISKQERYEFRKIRTRNSLFEHGIKMPRLSVYRGAKYIYAQVVDDIKGATLAAASSLEKEIKAASKAKSGKSIESAKVVGALLAKRALAKGVTAVCFDRGGRIYHGRIKALADAARAAGLKF